MKFLRESFTRAKITVCAARDWKKKSISSGRFDLSPAFYGRVH